MWQTATYSAGPLAILGNTLYAAYTNYNTVTGMSTDGFIGEYNATLGTTINAAFISGTNDPGINGIVFAVPEPSSTVALMLGAVALLGRRRGRGRSACRERAMGKEWAVQGSNL